MNTNLTRLIQVCAFSLLFVSSSFAQDDSWSSHRESKFYTSTSGEMIFSWSETEHPTSNEGVVMRWSPVFNGQFLGNYDVAKSFGLMFGLAVRNVGYIYQFNDVDGMSFRKKFRTYNLGIPLGLKVGNMNGFFVYGGYEFEFPFHYKEKTFNDDGSKINKFTSWFSDRTQKSLHAFFAGVQFKEGFNVKFKYYLTEFHNQNYTQTTPDSYAPSGDPLKPYEGLKSSVLYVAVSWVISKKNINNYTKYWDKD